MMTKQQRKWFLGSGLALTAFCLLAIFAHAHQKPAMEKAVYHIKNIKEGQVLSGDIQIIVTTNNPRVQCGWDWDLSIDKEALSLYSTSPNGAPDADGDYSMPMRVSTGDYPNGKHIISILNHAYKPIETRTVEFRNGISGVECTVDPAPKHSPDALSAIRIKAKLDKEAVWSVKIYDLDEKLVRKFSGRSQKINVRWDGRDSSGHALGEESYTGKVEALGQSAPLIINR